MFAFLGDGYFWLGLVAGLIGGALFIERAHQREQSRPRPPEKEYAPHDPEWFFRDLDP